MKLENSQSAFNSRPYLFLGLALITGIALVLFLIDQANMQSNNVAELKSELLSFNIDADESIWENRIEKIVEVEKKWTAKIWTSSSKGVLAAEIEQKIGGISDVSGLESAQIEVHSDSISIEGIQYLSFEIKGIGSLRTFLNLIYELRLNDEFIIIKELNSTFSKNGKARIQLRGVLPFELSVLHGDQQKEKHNG